MAQMKAKLLWIYHVCHIAACSSLSCVDVCLCVRASEEKRVELSTANSVVIQCTAVARHAVSVRSEGQRSRSHGYEKGHGTDKILLETSDVAGTARR